MHLKGAHVKKDKKQIIGEELSDEQIKRNLFAQPFGEGSVDFQLLIRAYRSLREDDFARFISFFVAEGRDVNAVDEKGNTLLSIIATHRHGEGYREALVGVGAK
jgi:ankyrin repeat protein